MQDIFGHLSWESLFQGDGTDMYLLPNYTSDRQDVSRSMIGESFEWGRVQGGEEQLRTAENVNNSALSAVISAKDDQPPPGVLSEGPTPPHVEVQFAEEWK